MTQKSRLLLVTALALFVALPLAAADTPAPDCSAELLASPADTGDVEIVDLEEILDPLAGAQQKAECDPNGCCVTTFYRTVNHNCGSCTRVWGTGGLQEKQKRTYNSCSGWSGWSTYESTCYPC